MPIRLRTMRGKTVPIDVFLTEKQEKIMAKSAEKSAGKEISFVIKGNPSENKKDNGNEKQTPSARPES